MGMDKKIEKKTWTLKRILLIAGALAIVSLLAYGIATNDSRSTLKVDKEKLSIDTIERSEFQEFIPVTGNVTPIRTVFLDAIEGGVIREVVQESGNIVENGDTILVLSNSNLRLEVMNREAQLYEQINNLRTSRLQIEQNTLDLKAQLAEINYQLELLKPQYKRKKRLFENDLISEEEFESVAEDYDYQKRRKELTYASFKQDSLTRIIQMRQLEQSEQRMWRSLRAVQDILENLVVKAPISGQLSMNNNLEVGQSIDPGQRLGQVDKLDGFKAIVDIDEHYLSRIRTGLTGTFTFDGEEHTLTITKVYPSVESGRFEVEMEFLGSPPEGLRRGQTLRIRLALGESTRALLLARGGFYQKSGGNWVYEITEEGDRAVKKQIRLGRQNPQYFEIISGLEPGDKVITSSYGNFGDNEVLVLQ